MMQNNPTFYTSYEDLKKYDIESLKNALKDAKIIKKKLSKNFTDIINDMYISRLEHIIREKLIYGNKK